METSWDIKEHFPSSHHQANQRQICPWGFREGVWTQHWASRVPASSDAQMGPRQSDVTTSEREGAVVLPPLGRSPERPSPKHRLWSEGQTPIPTPDSSLLAEDAGKGGWSWQSEDGKSFQRFP